MAAAHLEVRALRKSYDARQVVDGLDLTLEPGVCFGLLGPNGAGKTTTLRLCLGLTDPDSGEIRMLGLPVPAQAREARMRIGVVPQVDNLDPDFTVRENLLVYGRYFGIAPRKLETRIPSLLEFAGLTAREHARIQTLSGGMKRRVLVAQALVHKPPVIVLDEPTAGVDVELRQGLWQFVRRLNRDGHTIVLTTHYLEEAETHCSRIAMLKAGRIAALDSTRNLLETFSGLELRLRVDREALPQPFPGVLVSRDGSLFVLRLSDYRELERALARLREAEVKVIEMELQPPDLEDVFLRLTGR